MSTKTLIKPSQSTNINKYNIKSLNIATVFSGIGSFEQALQRMNIEHDIVFACDIDKFVKQSYFANYNISEERWYNDISDIDGTSYKNLDILVGGSPCQSFSMVGKRKGLEDTRGLLVFEFIRVLQQSSPSIFIFENVKGLLSHNSGNTWKLIEKEFKDLGYTIFSQILNAKNFGVPQNRERVFVVGFKNPFINFNFPSTIPLEYTMQDFLEDTCENKYFLPEKGIAFVTQEKNLKKKYTQINGKIALCQKANQQFNWHGDFVQYIEKYYLSDKVKKYVLTSGTKNFKTSTKTDLEIARPLLSTMAKMHRAGVDNYITRDTRLRKLTPRECLRLMGFSDHFKIVVSDTQMYRQSGNSIVSDVLVHIIDKIINTGIFNVI
ncbi:MAG: DNA (cytosine-5-)-methyltransferase [Spirochaetota bacterium]|nr:DNA (cytosine-5-)-methyltransferase [Spirochaetota bacterium]